MLNAITESKYQRLQSREPGQVRAGMQADMVTLPSRFSEPLAVGKYGFDRYIKKADSF